MSRSTTHSFEIFCRGWKVGLTKMHDAYHSTICHISTNADKLRQTVDSLAQWLEQWISTPAVRVRIPSGMWDLFFKLCIISYLRSFKFVRVYTYIYTHGNK